MASAGTVLRTDLMEQAPEPVATEIVQTFLEQRPRRFWAADGRERNGDSAHFGSQPEPADTPGRLAHLRGINSSKVTGKAGVVLASCWREVFMNFRVRVRVGGGRGDDVTDTSTGGGQAEAAAAAAEVAEEEKAEQQEEKKREEKEEVKHTHLGSEYRTL